MKYAVYILIPFLLFSCRKENVVKGELSYLVGDYDWIYSHSSSGYTTNQDPSDKYGIRITKKGKMFVFKNGVEIDKYRLISFEDKTDIMYRKGRTAWPIYYSGDTIWLNDLPISFGVNYYLKK